MHDQVIQWAHEQLAASGDPAAVVREAIYMCLHNVLVVIDGGTQAADEFSLGLFDNDGNELGPALHEWFVDHMFNTGRMK